MICYVLAMGKQHLGPHMVVGYGIKFFWPGLFITSPDHLVHTCTNFTVFLLNYPSYSWNILNKHFWVQTLLAFLLIQSWVF